MLKTKRPTSVEDFISGAKADAGQAPAAQPAKTAAKGKAAPVLEGTKKRGKAPSKYMATLDDETMSRYQLRFTQTAHRKAKAAAANSGMPLCDYILQAIEEKMEREKGKE